MGIALAFSVTDSSLCESTIDGVPVLSQRVGARHLGDEVAFALFGVPVVATNHLKKSI
jgi:hypothetical protein